MKYDKPDYNHYTELGDCPNCRHGLMWMSHGSIENPNKSFGTCFFCGYSDREEEK